MKYLFSEVILLRVGGLHFSRSQDSILKTQNLLLARGETEALGSDSFTNRGPRKQNSQWLPHLRLAWEASEWWLFEFLACMAIPSDSKRGFSQWDSNQDGSGERTESQTTAPPSTARILYTFQKCREIVMCLPHPLKSDSSGLLKFAWLLRRTGHKLVHTSFILTSKQSVIKPKTMINKVLSLGTTISNQYSLVELIYHRI